MNRLGGAAACKRVLGFFGYPILVMKRLDGLDALRGIAALVVLLFHAWKFFGGTTAVAEGWLAVDFFFALSGFVMARTYEARMVDWRGFMKLRFRRFWPMVLIGGSLGLPVLYFKLGVAAIPIALLNLAFIPFFFDGDIFPLNGPFWSLFYELYANAAHALVFRRFRDKHLAIGIAVLAVSMAVLGNHFGSLNIGASPRTFVAGFARVLLPYLIGVLLYRRWRDEPPLRVPQVLTPMLLPILVIAASAVPGWMPQLAFVLVGVPLLLMGGIRLQAGILGRWLGLISFPLYAVHVPILVLCRGFGIGEVAAIALALAIAWGVAWCLELPSRERKSRPNSASEPSTAQ